MSELIAEICPAPMEHCQALLPSLLAEIGLPGQRFQRVDDYLRPTETWARGCSVKVHCSAEDDGDRHACSLGSVTVRVPGGRFPRNLMQVDDLRRFAELVRSLHRALGAEQTEIFDEFSELPPVTDANLDEVIDGLWEVPHRRTVRVPTEMTRAVIAALKSASLVLEPDGAVLLSRSGARSSERCLMKSRLDSPYRYRVPERLSSLGRIDRGEERELVKRVWPATSMGDLEKLMGKPDQELGGLNHEEVAETLTGKSRQALLDMKVFSFAHSWAYWDLHPDFVLLVRQFDSGKILPDLAPKLARGA